MSEEKERARRGRPPHLDWKDYVAITIAALQTTLLPFVLLIIVVFVLALLLRLFIFR